MSLLGISLASSTINYTKPILVSSGPTNLTFLSLANIPTNGNTNAWQCIAFGNNTFLAVADDGTSRISYTSNNGANWSSNTTRDGATSFYSSCFGNSTWIFAGWGNIDRRLYTSTNLSNTVLTPIIFNYNIRNCCFGNSNTFVFVTSSSAIVSTTDFTNLNETVLLENRYQSVCFGKNLFVVVGFTSNIITSANGTSWTTSQSAPKTNNWTSVCYGNVSGGLFVAVSSNDVSGATGLERVMTSPDGINWTIRNAAQANAWQSVCFGGGLFVAVSSDGSNRVMSSPDGINWTAGNAAQANSWKSITYGNGRFMAVSTDGTNRFMTRLYP